MTTHIQIPSSPSDKNKIKKAIGEIAVDLQKIDDIKSHTKDVLAMVKEKFNMDPKLIRALATAQHKRNYQDKVTEYENFETAYESLVEGRHDA